MHSNYTAGEVASVLAGDALRRAETNAEAMQAQAREIAELRKRVDTLESQVTALLTIQRQHGSL